MYEVALSILKNMHDLGYEGYIVGGFPRDRYLGIENKDIDICTSMPLVKLEEYFTLSAKQVTYGSCTIQNNGYLFEVTVYRKDQYYNNRYPEITYVSTLQEDLFRRDFVMNTLCIDRNGNYVDYMKAKDDIDHKIIRSINNPEIKFQEDPLRIIRALRFAVDLDFKIEKELYNAIIEQKELLATLSKTRVQKEIDKIKNIEKWNSFIEELDLKKYLS